MTVARDDPLAAKKIYSLQLTSEWGRREGGGEGGRERVYMDGLKECNGLYLVKRPVR